MSPTKMHMLHVPDNDTIFRLPATATPAAFAAEMQKRREQEIAAYTSKLLWDDLCKNYADHLNYHCEECRNDLPLRSFKNIFPLSKTG